MASAKMVKYAVIGAVMLIFAVWFALGTLSGYIGTAAGDTKEYVEMLPGTADDDYLGSETCAACHEDQFNSFSNTKHSKLAKLSSWKNKVQGCESCHGPGKEHVEGGGDITKIISFKNKDTKQISETCLGCHAGKESHNNFRRGEHWRNNIGCTDCHSPHGALHANAVADSTTQLGPVSKQKPTEATEKMLKANEQQLCITCHNEMKAQFSKPFHHKVLEGTLKCSDCHNPHGGFETKQTKLAVGVDAACIKCHANKQGPFVFEHAPVKLEGCTVCHTPHGANNPRLLKRNNVRQLCLECHSGITEQLAPNAPSFHDQATVRFQNCTICHASIHGSNSSSVFFR